MTSLAAIRAWLNDPASGPEVYRRNWNGKCQALVWQICHRFGTAPVIYESADYARYATAIRGTVARDAPVGAVHFWKLGTYGHVALGLGGERVLMASTHVDEVWGTAVGVVNISDYNTRVAGETYIGWGVSDGANHVTLDTIATASTTITPLEEDDMKDDERAALFAIKDKLDATVRSGYEHLLDVGDLGTILTAVKANRGAPHPTRSDYGRLLDLGDLAQLLNVIPAGTSTDPVAVANALLPALLQGLGDRLVTDGDLAASLAPIAEALGKLPDEVRATLKAAL